MDGDRFSHLLKIPSDIINELEKVSYTGDIILVEDEEALSIAYKKLKNASRIGFDTESRPAFIKGQQFPVSLIQLSLENVVFIFRLKVLGFCEKIIDILSDENIEKIGVGVKDDIKRLKKLGDFNPANFTDLAEIAKKKGLIQCGIRGLTARYLNKRIIKSSQTTNWAKKGLSKRQLMYAATDAWVCLYLKEPLLLDNTDYFALKEIYDEKRKAQRIE